MTNIGPRKKKCVLCDQYVYVSDPALFHLKTFRVTYVQCPKCGSIYSLELTKDGARIEWYKAVTRPNCLFSGAYIKSLAYSKKAPVDITGHETVYEGFPIAKTNFQDKVLYIIIPKNAIVYNDDELDEIFGGIRADYRDVIVCEYNPQSKTYQYFCDYPEFVKIAKSHRLKIRRV